MLTWLGSILDSYVQNADIINLSAGVMMLLGLLIVVVFRRRFRYIWPILFALGIGIGMWAWVARDYPTLDGAAAGSITDGLSIAGAVVTSIGVIGLIATWPR